KYAPAERDGEPTVQAGENIMSQPRPHGLGSKNWALQAHKSGLALYQLSIESWTISEAGEFGISVPQITLRALAGKDRFPCALGRDRRAQDRTPARSSRRCRAGRGVSPAARTRLSRRRCFRRRRL